MVSTMARGMGIPAVIRVRQIKAEIIIVSPCAKFSIPSDLYIMVTPIASRA